MRLLAPDSRRDGSRSGGRPRAAMVVAHPDDETVGAGGCLRSLSQGRFLFVTDGSPRDLGDARSAGFDSRPAYARARRAERERAFEMAGIAADRIQDLDLTDREAVLELPALTRAVAAFLRARPTDLVLTHPYEGGHPDHDACALAVQCACNTLRSEGTMAPAVVEMAFYHGGCGSARLGEFLQPGSGGLCIPLDHEMATFKAALLGCYSSQQRMLGCVPLECERYRPSPGYDFSQPPHEGLLLYESFGFGVRGSEWRRRALAALTEVDQRATLPNGARDTPI